MPGRPPSSKTKPSADAGLVVGDDDPQRLVELAGIAAGLLGGLVVTTLMRVTQPARARASFLRG